LRITQLIKPSTPEKFRKDGYGQFRVVYDDGKKIARLYGKPDTCAPSFIISGKFRMKKLQSGNISFYMDAKEKYTYALKNPNLVTIEDVNHFIQELELDTKKGTVMREKLYSAVPATVEAFKRLDVFTELDMETRCDFFRVHYEIKLKAVLPGRHQKLAIQKLTGNQLKEVHKMVTTGLIWKLWFDKFCSPFGLKEMTYEGWLASGVKLPKMFFLAFRIYNFLKSCREDGGHDLFPRDTLAKHFKVSEKWATSFTDEEFEAAMEILMWHGLKSPIEGYIAFPKDIMANCHIIESLSKIQGDPVRRDGTYTPCKPSPHLTEKQRDFIQHVHCNKITLLQGPPGTGKTEGLVAIMSEFKNPLVVTYGGRMVCALHERFGGRPETAHTIHYVCCVREFVEAPGTEWLSKYDLLVIDEGSNVDVHLFSRLIRHMSHVARLVIVGDVGQIFPIKPGCPFYDLLHAFPQHTFVLDENKRVDPDSRELARASALINKGEPIPFHTDALQLHTDMSQETFEGILEKFAHDIMSMQIVTLRNEERRMLNKWTEEYLLRHNILQKSRFTVRIGNQEYYPGKKIMFTKNVKPNLDTGDDGYKNGELGQILTISRDPLELTLTNGKHILLNDAFDMCPGYATTCNKAQGSEWKRIIFWVYMNPNPFFTREFPYVAVSRAKKQCHIIARPDDLATLSLRKANRRSTLLSQMLARESLPNLEELVPYEDVELRDSNTLKLLSKDVAAVPLFVTEASTTKKGKKIKTSKF